MKKDLKDKFDVINKKINHLQMDSNQHETDIQELRELIKEVSEKNNNNNSNIDLSEIQKKLE